MSKICNLNQFLTDRKRRIKEKIRSLDEFYQKILCDPTENLNEMEEILKILKCKTELPSIKCKVLLKLTEIFIDLAPGYKITNISEDNQKREKNVKQIFKFEHKFLSFYTDFVQILITLQTDLARSFKNYEIEEYSSDDLMLKTLSQIMSQLLLNLSHFNLSDKIYNLVIDSCISFSNQKHILTSLSSSVQHIFLNDSTCDSSTYIVKQIIKYSKNRLIPAELLNTFQHLNILDLSNTEIVKKRKKSKTISKRVKKRKEMLKTEETHKDTDVKRIHQNKLDILSSIFTLYLRYLKNSTISSDILSACLNGVGKFCDILDIGIYIEIIHLVMNILSNPSTTPGDKLVIVKTVTRFPTNIDPSIELDLSVIYHTLYQLIFVSLQDSVLSKDNDDFLQTLLQSISSWLVLNRWKQIPISRCMAFVKRLSILALQLQHSQYEQLAKVVKDIFNKFFQLQRMFDSQSEVGQSFLEEVDHPDHCFGGSAILWESHLFKHHFDTSVKFDFNDSM